MYVQSKSTFFSSAGLLVVFGMSAPIAPGSLCGLATIISNILLRHLLMKVWIFLFYYVVVFPRLCSVKQNKLFLELKILILVVMIFLDFETFLSKLNAFLAFPIRVLMSCSVSPTVSTMLPRYRKISLLLFRHSLNVVRVGAVYFSNFKLLCLSNIGVKWSLREDA